jgi:hypothetical protein
VDTNYNFADHLFDYRRLCSFFSFGYYLDPLPILRHTEVKIVERGHTAREEVIKHVKRSYST